MMMSSNNNNNSSTNPFVNHFNNPYEPAQIPEEKLDQFDDTQARTMMPSYFPQQQFQSNSFQQPQWQQQQQHQMQQQRQQLQMQMHQLREQVQFQPETLNGNQGQGFIPLDTTQPTSQSLQAMMNPGVFNSFVHSFNNNSNPFEPSPIVEKSLPMKVVSSTPANFSAARVNSTTINQSCAEPHMGINRSKRILPEGFEPCDTTIICGNKRKFFESKGNIRFREVCKMFTKDYNAAPTKVEKSAVVNQVMTILREDCPSGGAAVFVTPQGGRWYAVSERTSREKVGTFFRDCLADTYKSSAKNKIAKRKMVKQDKTSSANSSSTSSSESDKKPSAAKVVSNTSTKNNNNEDDGSLGSMSFYDVNDFTSVTL